MNRGDNLFIFGSHSQAITVLVLSKLKNKRNSTATATQRFKVFCDI